MQIVNYQKEHREVWDSFVRKSKNGTFLICRNFMEYHSDRFTDHSLLFYDKSELLAVLPANIDGNILFSHQGLTYGGLILSEKVKQKKVLEIFSVLIGYLKKQKIERLVYKAIPHIYHRQPSEEDLYALFRNNASLTSRAVSSAVYTQCRTNYAQLRKRQIKKASAFGLIIAEKESFTHFWQVLEENLSSRHHTKPVHSVEEIQHLKCEFPQEIRLFTVEDGGKTLAGCLIFETEKVAHVQYISANEEGKRAGALDLLFDRLITEVFKEKKYIDYGISTENGGNYLNEGLIAQKEGFGGRAVVYDTYEINIQ